MAFLGTKFVYNGLESNDVSLGLEICSFDDSTEYEANTFLTMTPVYGETVSSAYRKDYGAKYEEVLIPTCSVAHADGSEFTNAQVRQILRWLTGSRELKWLTIYGYDGEVANILCRVTSISEQKLGDITIGFNIEWTANSPYSFSDIIEVSSEISEETNLTIDNNGDELFDYVYPYIEFQNNSGSSLEIYNEAEDRTFLLANLGEKELIVIDNLNQIIYADKSYRVLGDDFNKNWVRFPYGENKLKITGDGTILIKYRLPLKVGEF